MSGSRMQVVWNLARGLALTSAVSVGAIAQEADRDERSPTGNAWEDMDYGPFLTTCIEVEDGHFAYKGVAMRVDGDEGGVARGKHWMLFDTDTLRWVSGWSDDFIDWRSIVFDGSHQTHARRLGRPTFFTTPGAGWARPGTTDFEAPRTKGRDGKGYGPIPRDWAQYGGLWRQEGPPIVHYTVGSTPVSETASSEPFDDGARAFRRHLEVGAHAQELLTQICRLDGRDLGVFPLGEGRILARLTGGRRVEATSASGFDGRSAYQIDQAADLLVHDADFSLHARFRTEKGGTLFAKTADTDTWVRDGVTLFVRGGRLCYDIGWVGVVVSSVPVADGAWHDALLTFDHFEGVVRLYVDGQEAGQKELRPEAEHAEFVARVGTTAANFPDPSTFEGEIESLSYFDCLVDPAETASATPVLHLQRAEDGALVDAAGERSLRAVSMAGSGTARPAPVHLEVIVEGPAEWSLKPLDGRLVLVLPPSDEIAQGRVTLHGKKPGWDRVHVPSRLVDSPSPTRQDAPTLSQRCAPVRAQWPATLESARSVLGDADAPWVVEDLGAPLDNPYGSWFRIGDFAFTPDGDRAAVVTWMGDVWWVSGLNDATAAPRWRRFAAGLYQPLGVALDGEAVFVLGRDQITRLVDVDQDGEADHYHCFHNDLQVTEHFHEFAMALQKDEQGRLYFMKGACHAKDCTVPQHGTLIRVSADGTSHEVLARGFRAPNGLFLDDDGAFYSSDQEGHWTPANRINRIVPGGFYGYRWAYDDQMPEVGEYDAPLCWIDHDFDISPAAQLEVVGSRWGPLEGQLLSLSYGTGQIALCLREQVGEVWQGAMTRMPIATFPTGIMRGRFHPADGQLYVSGLFGWSSRRTRSGGLYRVRWNEQATQLPLEFHATDQGLLLRFAQPLDAERCARAGVWEVKRWNYRYAQRYGSDDFKVSDGQPGREEMEVESVRVSKDGCSVLLGLRDFRPCDQMSVNGRLRSADGARFSPELFLTVHALGSFAPYSAAFE